MRPTSKPSVAISWWVILQKAADRQHWVISVEDGVTAQGMGNLLTGVLNDPPAGGIPNWSNVEDMATAVADFLHRHVQILRGSALGHTHRADSLWAVG